MARRGFTLIELIVVIAIIAVLAAIIVPNVFRVIEKAKISRAIADAKVLRVAAEGYYADIGFWPPDVPRGHDPGLARPFAYNADTGEDYVPGFLPPNYQTIVENEWDGPYIEKFPNPTPWAGRYDWNYWRVDTVRYGVLMAKGCYAGIQGDADDNNTIPPDAEQIFIDKGIDAGGSQLNGEVQLLLVRF